MASKAPAASALIESLASPRRSWPDTIGNRQAGERPHAIEHEAHVEAILEKGPPEAHPHDEAVIDD